MTNDHHRLLTIEILKLQIRMTPDKFLTFIKIMDMCGLVSSSLKSAGGRALKHLVDKIFIRQCFQSYKKEGKYICIIIEAK